MNPKKQTLKRLFSIIGKYKIMLVLTILLAMVFVVISLYIPVLVGDAVDTIVSAGNVNFDALMPLLVKIIIIVLFGGISQWVMSIINNYITYNTVRDIRKLAFDKLMKLPVKYIVEKDTSVNAVLPTSPVSYTILDEISLPVATGNAKFLGWYDNPECTGEAITSISKGTTGNIVLYAKWEK